MGEWAADPGQDEARLRAATGRGWDAWAEVIDAGPGPGAGHTAIAAWLVGEGVDAWWAQAVTVGYERIRGLRLPGQMPDGTFTVSRSRTLDVDPERIRAALLDDARRSALLGEVETTLRSRPTAKSLRFAAVRAGEDLGVVAFAADRAGERTRLTVTHEKLLAEGVEPWKAHWAAWLRAADFS
ncbi:hypothetical protein [Microbacterium excoecariae]|uniref:hypothetical protein n=1 Tax=Microbacterium excoecariae TaxID=2715210 RepID=UPI00140A59BA|nr:hypothetical protein [Microbacterium excoecariae]NHI16310.1 hypothetical protein [Microbacterium excoecariae]